MPVSIKNRWNGEIIATVEDTDDLREAVIRLVRKGVSLRGADLNGANLSDANLRGANLSGAYLSGANLSGAQSTLSPLIKVDSLNRKILAAIEAGGCLDMGAWHTCETTHCRAGWAIHLAGPAGAVLESCYGAPVAGALIYQASCPQLEGNVPDFYTSNEDALADIRRCAEMEPPI